MKSALRSIRARLLILAAVWIAVALMAAFLAIGTVLERFVTTRYDAELRAMADGLIAAIEVNDDGLELDDPPGDPRFQTPLSGWYWQLRSGARVLARSESLFDSGIEAIRIYKVGTFGQGPRGEPLRILHQTVTLPGSDTPVDVVVTAPARDIRGSLDAVRRPLALSLLVLGLAVAVAVQVGAGLGGMRRLGGDLRRVREGEAERLTRPGVSELDPLVDEINAALDQNAALLARSRQHLGNLAHSLKTPLAALSNDMAPDAPGQALITRMDRLIGWHLRRARSAQPRVLGQTTPVTEVIDDILLVLRRPMEDRGIAAEIDCPPGTRFAGERQDLEEMIGNLAENAVKYGQRRLRVIARPGLTLIVEDDGPGIDGVDAERALERGARLDETGPAGSGLGLSIVADLAMLHGGSLRLGRSNLGGLRAELTLPD